MLSSQLFIMMALLGLLNLLIHASHQRRVANLLQIVLHVGLHEMLGLLGVVTLQQLLHVLLSSFSCFD